MDYQKRLNEIKERIAQSCGRVGRDPSEVTIVAVTKYVGVEETQGLLEAGLLDLGENRLQVAMPKLEAFADAQVRWHYIGSLQSKKVKDVIARFQLIHSLDRLELAAEIHKRATQAGTVVPCLVQVNVSGEESKSGVSPEEVADFLQALRDMSGIEVRGYMTMAPLVEDSATVRHVFRGLRELRDELLARSIAPKTAVDLSMGMSGDFEVAVEEGATIVRLGSVLVKP